MPWTETSVAAIAGDRWSVVTRLIDGDAGSVLDVGCRGRELVGHLPGDTRYVGMDLFPPADVIASAEDPFPFADDEFDTVVLADVLEHLDNPHRALDEAMRVGARSVIVLLPNLYTLLLRVQYARGRPSNKYLFGPDNSLDRHRWVLNFEQAAAFTRGRAERNGWTVAQEYGHNRAFRRPLVRLAYRAARLVGGPNLWSWEYVARLEPRDAGQRAAATSSSSIREKTVSSL
jgi:SAM-dependent methyltransferase